MSGKLYLCATPIGNLEDITLRVLRTLKEVDLIAAEDTRNSIKLLNHFEIKTPMTSYHEYNKIDKAYTLIEKMQSGMNIALITDAGTPGISDPGEELAAMCYEAGIEVTSLPGPAACITALTLSGLPTRRFAFEAFLPMDKKERREVLDELVNETRTIIMYEAPHKLVRTLKDLKETLGNRRMTLCRELTKKHETAFHTTIDELIAHYENEKPLGECVLVIEGKPPGTQGRSCSFLGGDLHRGTYGNLRKTGAFQEGCHEAGGEGPRGIQERNLSISDPVNTRTVFPKKCEIQFLFLYIVFTENRDF